jgi:hypothetical protein
LIGPSFVRLAPHRPVPGGPPPSLLQLRTLITPSALVAHYLAINETSLKYQIVEDMIRIVEEVFLINCGRFCKMG